MSRNKLLILAIALLTVAAQLFIPISMSRNYQDILQTGERFLFKVEPRDPADPFKGRYVVLTFPISSGQISNLDTPEAISSLPRNTEAYAVISKDINGFAKIRDIQITKPYGHSFITIKNSYRYQNEYNIRLPFDRYYAEESKAPQIEALLWNRARDENRQFHADIRIKNGLGVIAELYVEDTPILEYLKRDQNNSR